MGDFNSIRNFKLQKILEAEHATAVRDPRAVCDKLLQIPAGETSQVRQARTFRGRRGTLRLSVGARFQVGHECFAGTIITTAPCEFL